MKYFVGLHFNILEVKNIYIIIILYYFIKKLIVINNSFIFSFPSISFKCHENLQHKLLQLDFIIIASL